MDWLRAFAVTMTLLLGAGTAVAAEARDRAEGALAAAADEAVRP